MKKRLAALFLSMAMALTSLVAVAPEVKADDETYTFIFSHENAETSFVHQMVTLFKEKMEEATDGHVIIDIYPNAQLGSKLDNWQGMSDNTIQMLLSPGSHMDDRFNVVTIPNLFATAEECNAAYSEGSELLEAIRSISEELGFKTLCMVPIGFRTMSSNKKVEKFEDIAGQNIRVMEMDNYIALWKAYGANPTPIAFSELYLALQQGLVDAQENPLDVILTNKLYEQQKYIIDTNHEPFYWGITCSGESWNALPEEYQNIMMDVVAEVRQAAFEGGMAAEASALETMMEAGVELCQLSDDDRAAMQKACEEGGVYDLYRQYCGDELFDLALSVAESLQAQ